jgi:hypothetical protein
MLFAILRFPAAREAVSGIPFAGKLSAGRHTLVAMEDRWTTPRRRGII